MTGLESIGAVAGGLIVGALAALSFLGKIVDKQISKSFEHSINGDGENDLGLRSSLKELRTDVKDIAKNVNSICQDQAVMKEHVTHIDEKLDAANIAAEKALQLSRENADQLAYLK